MGAPLLLWLGAAPLVHGSLQRLRYNGQLPIRNAPSARADGTYLTAGSFGNFYWGSNGVGHLTNDATVTLTLEHHDEPAAGFGMRLSCLPRRSPIDEFSRSLNKEFFQLRHLLTDGCTCKTGGGADRGYPCPGGPLPTGETLQVVSCPIYRSAADYGPWPGGSLYCTVALLSDDGTSTNQFRYAYNSFSGGCADVIVHHSTADVPPSPPPGALAAAWPGVYDMSEETSYPLSRDNCWLTGTATVPVYAASDASVAITVLADAFVCGPEPTSNVSIDTTLTLSLGTGGRHDGVLSINGGNYEFVLDAQRLSYSLVDYGASASVRAGYAAYRGPPPPPPTTPGPHPPSDPPVPPMPFASELDDGAWTIVILILVAVVLALVGVAVAVYYAIAPSDKDKARNYNGI